jgi:SOS response regulatory protein OraA/RecX
LLKPERFVFDKLRYEDFGDEVIDSVIKRLREEGSVNDYKYCLKHSQKRLAAGNVSRKYIVCELREKGIDDSLTERCLDELGADDREIACRIAKKRLKSGDKKEKIKRFLSGKGFSAGTIIFAVDTCDTSDFSESELVFDSDFDM